MTPEEFLLIHPCFTTKTFASAIRMRTDSASRKLNEYAKAGFLTKVTRGIWANAKHPHFTPYSLVPLLLEAEHGYVSFLSALHRHGLISQIPQRIFVATTGHARRLSTSLVAVEFIQLHPRYHHHGVEWLSGNANYGLACAEKALLDCLYLSTRKGRRFSKFPELDFESFDARRFQRLLKEHHFPMPIEIKIMAKFGELFVNRSRSRRASGNRAQGREGST